MVGIFSRFSVGRSAHRRSKSAFVLSSNTSSSQSSPICSLQVSFPLVFMVLFVCLYCSLQPLYCSLLVSRWHSI
ncbi:hypothetical protein V6Z12_A11G040800 [Gossypium hirsutum]